MITTNPLSEGLRLTLCSYAQGVNAEQRKTGNLFQQNTKSKCVTLRHSDYTHTCFHYIHQNPLKCGLVEKIESWRYSSFKEYITDATGGFCNKRLAAELLDLNMEQFYFDSYELIEEDVSKTIF